MRNTLDFATTPTDEHCAQVGQPGYLACTHHEFSAMCSQLERMFGPVPAGVEVRLVPNAHDFGVYFTIGMTYDTDNREQWEYVDRVEREWPDLWDAQARDYMARNDALDPRPVLRGWDSV